jgi:hypothetical protein
MFTWILGPTMKTYPGLYVGPMPYLVYDYSTSKPSTPANYPICIIFNSPFAILIGFFLSIFWFISTMLTIVITEVETQLMYKKTSGRVTRIIERISDTVKNAVSYVGEKTMQGISSVANKVSGTISNIKNKFNPKTQKKLKK